MRHLRLRVEPDAACESDVWLLLARHTANPLEKNEFISLDVALASAISRQDGVVALPPPPAVRALFVHSPNAAAEQLLTRSLP